MAGFFKSTDSFAAATSGATQESYSAVPDSFSLSVNEVGGTATSWTVVLEGSNDGVTWVTILTHTQAAPGKGLPIFQAAGVLTPVAYFRTRCTAIVLGTATSIKATAVGA